MSEHSLSQDEVQALFALARAAIQAQLERHTLKIDPEQYSEALRARRAPFVTLYNQGALRGCIGALEAQGTLVEEVARLAAAAARDHRFKPVTEPELSELTIQLSILTPGQPLDFTDDADLAAKLRPGVDGLILSYHGHRGTLLPQVWEDLPDPIEFIRITKQKAGLPPDYAAPSLRAEVYQAEKYSE